MLATIMTLAVVTIAILVTVTYGGASVEAGPTTGRQLEGFTLEDVLSGRYYADSFNGTWISGPFSHSICCNSLSR